MNADKVVSTPSTPLGRILWLAKRLSAWVAFVFASINLLARGVDAGMIINSKMANAVEGVPYGTGTLGGELVMLVLIAVCYMCWYHWKD